MTAASSGRDRRRRVFLAVFVGLTSLIALGVLWQAFAIVAYVRGAGETARDLHVVGAYVVHQAEILVFLAALGAFPRDRWRIGLSLLLPVYGTFQVFVIGNTDRPGGWMNGLHGALALVVLLQTTAMTVDGVARLRGERIRRDAVARAPETPSPQELSSEP